MKKFVFLAFVSVLLLLSMPMFSASLVTIVRASTTHDVYSGDSIQEAINAASLGDTIFVHNGTYYEHVIVNKSISLIGENRDTTIIDGNGVGSVVYVIANNVNISGFTIQNSGEYWIYGFPPPCGIHIHSNDNAISGNNVSNNFCGIYLNYSSRNKIVDNIARNFWGGIGMQFSDSNRIDGNFIIANAMWLDRCSNNTIYHNNFLVGVQVYCEESWNTKWDNGYPSGGNYWSDYTGVDEHSGVNQDQPGSDGIGDVPYSIDENNQDNYPLMELWNFFDTISPIADAGSDQSVVQGTTVFFNGSRSTDNLAIKSYLWTFVDVTPKTLTGVNPKYKFTNVGNFQVTLNVTDYADNWDTDTIWVNVSAPSIIHVPTDYSKIQEAINAAEPYDIIQVAATTYYENVIVNKTVMLIGEESTTTIIDGNETWNPILEITVMDVEITGFTIQHGGYGIYLKENGFCNIHGNIRRNNTYGIAVWDSDDNTIAENNVSNNRDGIALGYHSSNNVIVGNNVSNNYGGISLTQSSFNELRNNNMTGNAYNFGVIGYLPEHFQQDIDTSNTIDGKLVYYLSNQKNLIISPSTFSDIGYLGLVNSEDITVKALNLKNNFQGVLFAYTKDSTIENVNASHNLFGIYLMGSENNTITNNLLTDNREQGIALGKSHYNTIVGNLVSNNGYGILLLYSGNNTISGNNITNNSGDGIELHESSNNSISGNNITNNGYGISLYKSSNSIVSRNNITNNDQHGISISDSSNNTVSGNTITNNEYGIRLSESSNNSIYHNNFINNTNQVDIPYSGYVNFWDDGAGKGNFWSDYPGVDADGDNIGDTPYEIDENNQDRYPLIVPVVWNYSNPIPVVWHGATYSVALSGNSTILTFKFNQPQMQISFDVTGPSGTIGFCNVTIPKSLLKDNPWTVTIDGQPPIDLITTDNATHTFLYFTYTHVSTSHVIIQGTEVIPEFPTWASMLIILMVLTVAIAIYKRRLPKTPNHWQCAH